MSGTPETAADDAGRRTIASVEKACRIIDELYDLEGAGVTELAERLGVTKGTVHTQLATLREQGFVTKRGTTYEPSLRLLNIGEGIKSRLEVFEAAEQELADLAAKTGEWAHLMTEQNGWGYIVHKERGEHAATTTSRTGKQLHLHYTSTGKAILAHLPEERVEWIIEERGLPERTRNTITDRETLYAELEEIRETGVAFDKQEQINGARCVGAPITEPGGEVLGAVSVSAPVSRMRDERFEEELPETVSSAANVIEMNVEVNRLNG